MADYLLDTNHASPVMANRPLLLRWIQRSGSNHNRFGISMTVLGELYFAVYASQMRAMNFSLLHRFLNDVILWDFDSLAAEEFGKIQAAQKAKGRPIRPSDAQIAAVARVNGLTLLTADQHFQYVDQLVIENWLTAT